MISKQGRFQALLIFPSASLTFISQWRNNCSALNFSDDASWEIYVSGALSLPFVWNDSVSPALRAPSVNRTGTGFT